MINSNNYLQESKLNVKLDGANNSSFFDISKKVDSSMIIIDEFSEGQEKYLEKKNQILGEIEITQNEQIQDENYTSKENEFSSEQSSQKDNQVEDDGNDEDNYKNSQLKEKRESQLATNLSIFETFIKSQKKTLETQDKMPTQSQQYKKCNTYNIPLNNSKKLVTATTFKSRISQNQYSHGSYLSTRRKFNSQYITFDKVIRVLTLIKPQIHKFIMNYTLFGKFRQLDNNSRHLIGDKSDYFYISKETKANCFQKIISILISIFQGLEKGFYMILDKIPLFNPENKFRILISALIVCYNCFFLLLISFTVFFQADFGHEQHLFNYIAIFCWVTEMLIQMNTATYYEGDFITDRRQLLKIYLSEYFFFEILPLIFEGKTSENKVINILFQLPLLLKIKGMSIILIKLEFLILQHLKKHYILQIFKLLISLLLLTHLMACSYSILAQFELNILGIQETWLTNSQIITNQGDWWSVYIEAQLWAFHTVGNSFSVSVITQYEYAFTSFWMLISCVLYAYLVNNIGNVIQNINSNSENQKKDLNILNKYMQRKKIDLQINFISEKTQQF